MSTLAEYIATFGEEAYQESQSGIEPGTMPEMTAQQQTAETFGQAMDPKELLQRACGSCENCVKPICGSCAMCKVNRLGEKDRCCYQKVGILNFV